MAKGLDERIQALPQELQDAILEFTIATAQEAVVTITRAYTPPIGLSINRKIREKTAEAFYSKSSFYIRAHRYAIVDQSVAWISSLPAAHLNLVSKIRLQLSVGEEWRHYSIDGDHEVFCIMGGVWRNLEGNGVDVSHEILEVEIVDERDGKHEGGLWEYREEDGFLDLVRRLT